MCYSWLFKLELDFWWLVFTIYTPQDLIKDQLLNIIPFYFDFLVFSNAIFMMNFGRALREKDPFMIFKSMEIIQKNYYK
jgi:hypothetical protein